MEEAKLLAAYILFEEDEEEENITVQNEKPNPLFMVRALRFSSRDIFIFKI